MGVGEVLRERERLAWKHVMGNFHELKEMSLSEVKHMKNFSFKVASVWKHTLENDSEILL